MSTNLLAIVAAIYIAEGGAATRYPYGIRSVNTHCDVTVARRICETTVRNNYVRWRNSGMTNSFVDFLGDRYCPASADPVGNKNWKRNVKSILKRNESKSTKSLPTSTRVDRRR